MRFKKFTAADMRQALMAVKQEMGPDAVIVATRQLPAESLFGKTRIEVTAALEDPPPPSPTPPPEPAVDLNVLDAKLDPLRRELRALRGALRQTETDPQSIAEQLEDMRALLNALSSGAARDTNTIKEPPPHNWIQQLLQAADVAPHFARELAREAYTQVTPGPDAAHAREVRALKWVVRAHMRHDNTLLRRDTPQRVALVGPTGVGKTTTIAKLAAHARMAESKSVVLITLDTYRVGAREQLQRYADLLRVPLYSANDGKSFAAILARHSDADLVLVDTAGRGPTDGAAHITSMDQVFRDHHVSTLFTLACTTRTLELLALLRDYEALQPSGFIFTKLDEARVLGAVLNAQCALPIPVLYLTTGQRVPEDIALAEPEAVAGHLVHLAMEALNTPQRLAMGGVHAHP